MDLIPYIVPFAFLVLIETLTVRWIVGAPVQGLVSRTFATNFLGIALLMFVSLSGWYYGWWPDIRNWALRDSFFLFLLIKAPIFAFLFRRWGLQRIFTLHVLSNFVSIFILSLLFVFSPAILGINPNLVDQYNNKAVQRMHEIKEAIELYKIHHEYYPNYIWGGDEISWGNNRSPDPLISGGYLAAYPVNPLNLRRTYFEPRRIHGFRELWFGYKSEEFFEVRDLWSSIVNSDPRFGYRGAKMGNILPDPRMPETKLPENARFTLHDQWLPGGFFYRSYDLDGDGFADAYILGVCGDESRNATMDAYDARTDSLTSEYNGHIVISAPDTRRDGVIKRVFEGFPIIQSPRHGQEIPQFQLPVNPETGETIPIPFPFGWNVSAGNSEDSVTPENSEMDPDSGNDVENGS